MFIGLLTLELHLPGCDELKEKRHRLKGVIEKVRAKFNVSASETGLQDSHQLSEVAIAMVNSDRGLINAVFEKIEDYFANGDGLLISDSNIEWL